ncbi:MAG: transglutaminase family protein [Ramlibacter sp.]
MIRRQLLTHLSLAVGYAPSAGAFLFASGVTPPASARPPRSAFSPDVQRQLQLPENKIDTGVAALTFGKEVYPHIDVQAYSRKIDDMVSEARFWLLRYARQNDPESIIRALNTYYHKSYGVRYDKSPDGRNKRENYFMHHILDTGEGQCLTIPMLYMAVAQRLGQPVFAVSAPEHYFLRFADPRLKEQNIELTGEAGYSSDEEYAFNLNVSPKAIQSGAYLRTLNRRQFLGVLLMQNAIAFAERGDVDRAIRYLEKAAEIDPKDVYFTKNLQVMWMRKSKAATTHELVSEYREKAFRYFLKAEEMGWTRDPDANTRRKQ